MVNINSIIRESVANGILTENEAGRISSDDRSQNESSSNEVHQVQETDVSTFEDGYARMFTEHPEHEIQVESTTVSAASMDTDDMNKIPENSPSLLYRDNNIRFSAAEWYQKIQEIPVILAGAGGIGSFVAFMLSRVNPYSITVYDDDVIEEVNLAGQMFGINHIGEKKADIVKITASQYSRYSNVSAITERFTDRSHPGNVMICGFDNMEARKTFYNSWKQHMMSHSKDRRSECLFIDGRLAAEEYQVLAIWGENSYRMDRYENEFLFSDEEADSTVCSYKQTTFCAEMIAAVMVNIFVNFAANICSSDKSIQKRDIPFFTSYYADRMYFKTEC